MSETLLKVSSLDFSYQEPHQVLKGVSFEVGEGEILGILGPNGGGKSTLLKLITGFFSPTSGAIQFYHRGKAIDRPPMVYLPQREAQNFSYPMTILELLQSARLPYDNVTKKECQKAMDKVSLNKDINQELGNLSGGEYQRVLLAKAWLNDSQLVLMDEPTKGLDGVGQDKLLELVQEFKAEKNAGIILVEHNIAQILKHSDRLLCLNKTFHWHDRRDMLKKDILESTYHCEFEHLLIHENRGDILDHEHHQCAVHDHEGEKKS